MKYLLDLLPADGAESLPSRGAWIEIMCFIVDEAARMVAPLTGSVDWNVSGAINALVKMVAPLTGSVD